MDTKITISESTLSRFLFSNTKMALLWLVLRVYVGWLWLEAGWEKFNNPVWIGDQAGVGISGFFNGSLAKVTGAHPDVSGWYAYFIEHFAMQHAVLFSYLITYGEIAVGLGLIVGLFTGLAAFFGAVMNFNFMFAGTVSINPLMLLIGIFIISAYRVAGFIGLDYFVLPLFRKYFKSNIH